MPRYAFANRVFNPWMGQGAALQGVGTDAPVEQPDFGGTTFRAVGKSNVRPSYKTGFARSAGESAYPTLWDNMHSAFVPELGLQRLGTYPDLLSGNPDYTMLNMEADNFGVFGGRQAIDTGSSKEYLTSTNAIPSGTSYPWSVSAWVYPESVHEGYVFSSLVAAQSGRHVGFGYRQSSFRVMVRNTTFAPKDTAAVYPVGSWYHVAFICKADNLRELWVNGELALTVTLDVTEPAFDAIYIGALRNFQRGNRVRRPTCVCSHVDKA